MCATCTARQQREYGCDAREVEPGKWEGGALAPDDFDGVRQWQCLRRPVKDDPAAFAELMGFYGLYAEGVLADDGALMSQAAKYVTLMRLVHSVVNECEGQKMNEAKSRSR